MRSFVARSPDVWRLLKAHERQQAARRASAQAEAGVVADTIGVATSTRVGDTHKITAAQTPTFEGLRLPALWNLWASERPGEARNGGHKCTYILGDPRGDLSLAAPAPLRRTIDMVQLEASRVVDMLAASLGRAAAVHYVVRIQRQRQCTTWCGSRTCRSGTASSHPTAWWRRRWAGRPRSGRFGTAPRTPSP